MLKLLNDCSSTRRRIACLQSLRAVRICVMKFPQCGVTESRDIVDYSSIWGWWSLESEGTRGFTGDVNGRRPQDAHDQFIAFGCTNYGAACRSGFIFVFTHHHTLSIFTPFTIYMFQVDTSGFCSSWDSLCQYGGFSMGWTTGVRFTTTSRPVLQPTSHPVWCMLELLYRAS